MRSIPKTASSSPRRNLPLSLVAAVAMVLGGQSASAQSLTWDADGSGSEALGGTALWNTSDVTWWNGTTNVKWNNTTPASAIFGGFSGIVAVSGNIKVGNITFDTPDYVIEGDLSVSSTLELVNTTINGSASATISANLAGTTGLTVTNTSASGIILSGTNTYSGETKVGITGATGATLRIDTAEALGNSNLITVASGSGLQINTADPVGAGKTLSVAGSGVNFLGAVYAPKFGNATWAGTVKLDAADVRVGADVNGTLTLSGAIQNGTANSLTISAYGTGANAGAVIISGTQNTYTGSTSILRGVLKLGANDALPTSTTLSVDSGTAAEDSIFDLNGFNQTVGGVTRGSLTGGGSFITNNGATAATITISPSGAGTYNGIIQDGFSTLALTKAGAGTQTLSGANTYSGVTTVSAGTLVVGHASALGSTSAGTIVQSGGTLAIADGVITNPGESVTLASSGQNLGALNTVAGSTNAATWQGSVTLGSADARVGARAGGTLNISGPILGSGTFQNLAVSGESGTGVIIVSAPAGSSNYTGTTSVIRGILKIGANDALPTGSSLDVDTSSTSDNATFDLNGFNQTLKELKRSDAGGGTGGSLITNNGASTSTLTVNGSTTSTFSGTLKDGSSPLALTRSGSGSLTLSGTSNYSGATTVNGGTLVLSGSNTGNSAITVNGGTLSVTGSSAGTATTTVNNGALTLSGAAGTVASANFQLNGGTFTIDNTATNSNARIADNASFVLNGGTFVYKGSNVAGINSSETIGSITLGQGVSTLSIERGGTNTADLTASSLTRPQAGGIALIKSTTPGRLVFTTSPTLVGDGTGTKDAKIVPFLVGASTSTATAPDTFVTYSSTTGLRTLDPATEFESNVVAGANVRVTGNTPNSNSTTINSLVIAGGQLNIATGQTITNTSGAVLFTTANNVTGGTFDFGAAEGIVTVNSGLVGILGSKITGTNGLSFYGIGTGILGLGSNQNTYSGETTLVSGVVVPQVDSIGAGGAVTSGPFGTSTVVFAGGQIRPGSAASATPTLIGNAIRFQTDTTFASGGGKGMEFSGPVAIAGGTRTLTTATDKKTTFSGAIGDGGHGFGLTLDKTASGTGSFVLSGDNTYTGPTTVKSGTVEVSGSISGSISVAVNNTGMLLLSGSAPDRIADTAPVTLGNSGATGTATFSIDNLATSSLGNPFQETTGKLVLASDAVLDLGLGSSGTILHFADSSNNPWNGTLKIYNWSSGTDQLFFGSALGGLTSAQISQVLFYSDNGSASLGGGMMLSSGELVPVSVPEPSTLLCSAAMLGFLGCRGRRKTGRAPSLKSSVKSV